ncbi:MAG: GNAT family N-acetyltransferase [Thermotogae bacterium]|nr:GNAT family N-acetyltransferase [Thermotogota bacterium]
MLEGQKVKLREYRKEDIPKAWEYINDPDVRRFLNPGIPYPMRLEDEEKWFEEQRSGKDTYNFAIILKDTGEYIGGCGINTVDWKNRHVCVGIFLGKKFWSKGYGTDAMKVLVNFIFSQMNINKVYLHVYSFNKRAIKSYEKCGFKIEAVLREHIFRDGEYHDEYVMSILRREWKYD